MSGVTGILVLEGRSCASSGVSLVLRSDCAAGENEVSSASRTPGYVLRKGGCSAMLV